MKKKPLFYVEHIRHCIRKIQSYTEGVNEEEFLQNTLLQDAVIRNLEIIGEATKKLNPTFREK